MNYIDLILIVIILFYAVDGLERGLWALLADLFSFVASLVVALRLYLSAASFLVSYFSIPTSFAKALGFILVGIFTNVVLGFLAHRVLARLPKRFWGAWWSRILGIVPAVLDISILVAAFLTLLVSVPVSPKLKADVSSSKIGGFMISNTGKLERYVTDIFGGAIEESLTFLTVKPEGAERVDITYKPRALSVDEVSEGKMLELINSERVKVGARPLVSDQTIVAVARAHSRDMWERGYFSHTNPDGEDPFGRMREGGVSFLAAGENLALAPTVEFAHEGLMNSEGHRRNILDPNFGRVGIGVIDGGIYGKMFTQNFAD